MINFILYDANTGEIKKSGACQSKDFELQAETGFVLMEGVGDSKINYIKNGAIQTYTDKQRQSKSQFMPPYMVWSNDTFDWVDTRDDAKKLEQQKITVDKQRNYLLANTDWIVIRATDQGVPIPEDWRTYRQALRDIDKQPGYPWNVVWPTPPQVA
jgi:hypothetical protein